MNAAQSSAMFERSMLLVLRRAHAEMDRRGYPKGEWYEYRCQLTPSPSSAHVFARLGLQNNGTGSACDAHPAPTARPLGGPTDER